MKFSALLVLIFAICQPVRALPEAELQHYLDEAIKAGGGEVVIPPGVHLIEHGLTVKNAKKLRITGLDAEETVLKGGGQTNSLIVLNGCDELRIEKLTFEGAQDGIAEPAEPQGQPGAVSKLQVSRCFFQNQGRSALLLARTRATEMEVLDCTFRDAKDAGVQWGGQVSQSSVTHSHFTRCREGVVLAGAQRCLIGSNELSDCQTGIIIKGGSKDKLLEQKNFIALNAITRSSNSAIMLDVSSNKNSVLQNEISSSKIGLLLSGKDAEIRGNQISHSGLKDMVTSEKEGAMEPAKPAAR